MKNNYVVLNIKISSKTGKVSLIDLIKIDKKMNIIDKAQLYLNKDIKNKIMKLIDFCKGLVVIVSNAKKTLSSLLKILYENKIYNKFKFKYIDIDEEFNSSIDIYHYLRANNLNDLDILLYSYRNHGLLFRGITYPKYLCDVKVNNNKYYGYIVDFSEDKYVSYYSCLKEIKGEYFDIDEVKMLEKRGCKIILNVGYLSDESLMITNYYSIVDDNDKINNYIGCKKNNKDLRLVLWGDINQISKYHDLIDIVKEPWGYWRIEDINN